MPVLGITGGIATGKSSFVHALSAKLAEVAVFDADQAAHELLAADPAIRDEITAAFGAGVLGKGGWPERGLLRAAVFADPPARQRLEGILHPVIRQQWRTQADRHRSLPTWLLVDIPLLYETAAQEEFTRIAVVACSRKTQLERLRQQRQLAEPIIAGILEAQLDLGVKVSSAHHVLWNDSSLACLDRQAHLFADALRNLYG